MVFCEHKYTRTRQKTHNSFVFLVNSNRNYVHSTILLVRVPLTAHNVNSANGNEPTEKCVCVSILVLLLLLFRSSNNNSSRNKWSFAAISHLYVDRDSTYSNLMLVWPIIQFSKIFVFAHTVDNRPTGCFISRLLESTTLIKN